MRRLKLQMMTTLDGFVAGRNGDVSWITLEWDALLRKRALANLEDVDCILMAMGRQSTMQFIPYWASVAQRPLDPFHDYGRALDTIPKVVLSNTLARSEWPRTRVVRGDFVEQAGKLKALSRGNIIVFGGAKLAASLLIAGLVDEIHLLVNPVAIGQGLRLFAAREPPLLMRLVEAISYACGVVWLHYEPEPEAE